MGVAQADLARRLGLSQATVSLALGNHERISARTRARVLRVATQLGYRPNPLVSALMATRKRRRSRTEPSVSVAVLALSHQLELARASTPNYFTRLARGIDQRAREIGVAREYFTLDSTASAAGLPRVLAARGVRGLLLFPDAIDRELRPPSLDFRNLACLKIGLAIADRPNLHTISSDYGYSIVLILRTLVERGYQRIGLAMSRGLDWANGNSACGQFLSWQQHRPKSHRVPLLHTERTLPSGAELLQWYRRHRPEAVIGYTLETRALLQQGGFAAPDDFGYVQLSWHGDKASAGVDQRTDLVGATAMQHLLRLVQMNETGVPQYPSVTLVRGAWVEAPSIRSAADPSSGRSPAD